MKNRTIKTYRCECGEDFYEDDLNCVNCGKTIDKSKLKDEEIADIKYPQKEIREKLSKIGSMEDVQFLQSYVYTAFGDFFVSTIYRQSTALVETPPWFYETLAWKLDKQRIKEKQVADNSGAMDSDEAFGRHQDVCKALYRQGYFEKDVDCLTCVEGCVVCGKTDFPADRECCEFCCKMRKIYVHDHKRNDDK